LVKGLRSFAKLARFSNLFVLRDFLTKG